ncbi:LuxR C-terminal-related transcriptional regulator [Paraburkholderia dipogonis]|uniref:LuxR C-terminal-related transcriptional regulator n=2 Tax=Paraburkholderia TaxID=1822464 RepID=A0ABW9B747_9BURK
MCVSPCWGGQVCFFRGFELSDATITRRISKELVSFEPVSPEDIYYDDAAGPEPERDALPSSPAMYGGGSGRAQEVFQLARISRVLTDVNVSRLSLMTARAWQALLRLECKAALEIVEKIELSLNDLPSVERDARRWEIMALRAASLVLQDNCAAALALALSTIRYCGRESIVAIARTICRYAYWKLGDFERLHAVGQSNADVLPTRLHRVARMFDLSLMAAVEMNQLRFPAARLLAEDAISECRSVYGGDLSVASFAASIVGQVLYEQGMVDEAQTWLSQRLAQICKGGTIESAERAYTTLAKIAASRGQFDFAQLILKEAEALGQRRSWPRLVAACVAGRIGLLLEQDDRCGAEACLAQLAALERAHGAATSPGGAGISGYRVLARARLRVACGATLDDVSALRQLHCEAVCRNELYLAVQVAVCLIDALLAVGEQKDAASIFLRTLKLGATVGLHQTFVDSGPRVGELLAVLQRGDPAAQGEVRVLLPYIGSLLSRWRAARSVVAKRPTTGRPTVVLSSREHSILVLMSQGLSNKQIAVNLRIAAETVKSHAKKIFVKLAAKNRAEAVTRATQLGLIQV